MFSWQILSNGSLHITVAYMEDSGKYGCTAGNSGGLEREEVFLQVASECYRHILRILPPAKHTAYRIK